MSQDVVGTNRIEHEPKCAARLRQRPRRYRLPDERPVTRFASQRQAKVYAATLQQTDGWRTHIYRGHREWCVQILAQEIPR